MPISAKKQVARKATAKTLPQIGSFNFNRYRIQVGEDPNSGDKRYISPLDLAQEAVELTRSQVRHDSRLNAFADHMFKLAATCSNPEEFRDVCSRIRDEAGWGRRHPAPRIWIVYQSAIYKFWLRHKVRPLTEVAAPIMDNGRLQYDSRGEVQKQRVKVAGINQLKQVDRALQLVKRTRAQVPEVGGGEVQELVSKAQAVASDPYLVESIKRLVWAYTHLDPDSRKALLSGFGRLLKEFPVAEPFPSA